jgi:sugar phosphate isomerase/epimerase
MKLGTYESWFDGEPIVPGATLEERLALLETLGYDGIQIQRKTRTEIGLDGIKKALKGNRIEVPVWSRGGPPRLSATAEERRHAAAEVKEGLREAADLGSVGSIFVPIRQPLMAAPPPPDTLHDLQRRVLLEQLAEIAPVAEELGVKMILEPLNRYESHYIKQLGPAAAICREVGSPAITFMADFFHMNIEEIDLARAIEENIDRLSYVHLADSNRYEPGAGHLDFRAPLAALKRVGYDGWLTLECKILGENKEQALADSARLIRGLWAEV